MTMKNKNIGDKNRKISGKKIMLVTALLSGGVVIRVNNHINHSFGNPSREVINFDLTLESTDVLIDDKGTFYVGQGTPIDNFNIYDFVTILDESGNVIADKDVTLEWDVKEYFEGTTFGTKGEYLITITATTADGRTGELEYKLVVKEGHVFEEIKEIKDIPVDVNNTKDILDFQEYFRVLNSTTGADTGAQIKSTLEDEDLQSVGTTQVIFYTELDGIKFTNSVDISVVDTIAPRIDLTDTFNENGIEWNKDEKTITIRELDKTTGDFSLDKYATAYDASGDYEMSWDFNEVMEGKLGEIDSYVVTIKAIDASGNESSVEVHVNISTATIEFKPGITEVAFELFHTPDLNDPMNRVSAFYDVVDAAGNPVADNRISWDLTKEMLSTIGVYNLKIEILDENMNELIGAKGVTAKVEDTKGPEITLVQGASTTFDIEVDQFNSIDNLYMYLDGITNINDLVTITDNSGVWGYRLEYNDQELTDDILKTVGIKAVTLIVFDYDNEGNELNHSELKDENGLPMSIIFNVVDTKQATIIVTDEIINLEVVQNATKEMIEINNYAEITDNSGTFTWDLRVKGSQDDVMNYEDMLGKVTPNQGIELEIVVTDASGNVTYADMTLIVTDTKAPVFEVKKTEETININPTASEINEFRNISSYVDVSDNSGKFLLEWDFDTVVNTTVADVYDVIIKATDDSGNVSEVTITFTVVDNESPVIIVNTKTIEIEANEYTNKDELEFDINLNDYITVTDNSNGIIDTTFDYSNVDFSEIGIYDVAITATDAAGNESINIIELKVIAGEPKVRVLEDDVIVDTMAIENLAVIGIKVAIQDGKILIERAPTTSHAEIMTHLTIENLFEFLTITGETIESSSLDLSGLDFTVLGSNMVTLNATNNFGKTTAQTFEFVVIQEWDSILELKGDNFIDLEINTNEVRDETWFNTKYDVLDYVKLRGSLATANFAWDDTSITNIDFNNVGSSVITIWLNDGAGVRNEVSLNFNVIDTTAATISATDSTIIEINDKDASDYDVNTFASVTDNSDLPTGSTVVLSWNLDTQVDFTKVGTYIVTIKAVDASGNVSTKDITFEVEDTQPPVLTINPGMDVQTIEINSRDASNFNINSFVTAVDNSGVAPSLEWNIQDVDFSTVNSYTVEISATDKDMNKSNVITITFVIEDTIAPSINIDPAGLEELKVEIATKSESDYSDWLDDYVTVTDNSGESITPTWDITGVDFNTFGTYMVTITAVDASGNTTTQVVSFGVSDTTAPIITIKDDKEITTLEVFDGKLADFTLADFATCTDDSTCTIEWDIQNVDFSTVGTYVVTIKAVDIYGNESRAEVTIEVQDTTKPEIVITRPDILIAMDKYTSSDFNVNDFATVTDNYDTSVVLTWNIEDVDFNSVGEYTIVISAIDSNGNEAVEKEVKFKVEEFNITLTEVKPLVIEVDQANLESNFNVNDYFTAEDQNGVAVNSIVWNLTDDMLKTYGTYGIMLTITFDTDKKIEMEVTLEVVDNTVPTVTVDTTTTTIELGDSSTFDNLKPEDFVTVTDNSNDVTYSWDFDSVVEQTVVGTYTVSITVTDVAGNETVVTTEIVVEDTVAPDLVLNDDFNRSNMIWSKSTAELTLLENDKALGEIDLWELVTATDLSTGGLTISWNITEAQLNGAGHYTIDIEVSDGTLISTETITVNVLRPTPILNDFNVDKSHSDVTVNVDITNLSQAITSLVITLERPDGSVVDTYTQALSALDGYTINHVFSTGVTSNTEYKVVLEYVYETRLDGTDTTTITDTKDVKTLAYSQNDVLGTITDIYSTHKEIEVKYEINNILSLMTSAELILLDASGAELETHSIVLTDVSGAYSFTGLTPNNDYTVKIEIKYDFNDGNNEMTKVGDLKDLSTLAYNEHDVITDITGITQSPSTVSVDYNITDDYGLIVPNGMKAKIYDARDMSLFSTIDITSLSGTIQFVGLDANTSYIVVIEAELDLQDGTTIVKETGSQTATEAYHFDEISVNIKNVISDYNEITFDYEVHDPNSLLVGTTDANKLKVNISGQEFDLPGLSGTVKLSDYLNNVDSDTSYDVQIHFEYNLKDGKNDQIHDTNLYGFVESTREYDVDQDLTLTSHNLASDTKTIYVDYALRNLNNIGDMDTLALTITGDGHTEVIYLKDYFTSSSSIPLTGQIVITDVNGNLLKVDTAYQVEISIDYDLNDGKGIQSNLLLLEETEIKTKEVALVGFDVASTITRGYTFLNVDFVVDNSSVFSDLLDTFKIALLDENNNVVPEYDYVTHSVVSGTASTFKFENLKSDSVYTIVYRVDNPNYGVDNAAEEFVEITRRVSTRTYDTNLINVNYTLTQGLTYLQLQDIEIVNTNEAFEKIDYSSVIAVATYTTREGQVVTLEIDLGSLTEGDITEAIFTGIQSNTDVKIDFRLEYDLKDGEGVQAGDNELVISSESKTLEYDFTFVVESDEVVITGLTPGFTGNHLVIFEEVEGYTVKDVKANAFYSDNISFTQITIPRTLETIGENAFRNVDLTTVNLTSVFETIPTIAPRAVTNITGQGILVIGDNAFRDNNITSFDFTTTETIGYSAFRNNNFGLEGVVLGDTVSYVGQESFVNAGVTKLETGALLSDENFGLNSFYNSAITDITVGNTGFRHDSLGVSTRVFNSAGFSLTFTDSAVGIIEARSWRYSLGDSSSLQVTIKNVTIGDGITEIGASGFYQNELDEVIIGDSVERIGGFAFYDAGISKITFGKALQTIDNDAFRFNDLTNLTFLENLQTVGTRAFSSNKITELVLPNSVNYVGDSAFSGNQITKLTIGELLSDENFGTDSFLSNKIDDLTIGNVGFKHNSLGVSTEVFNNSGFSLTFADTAVGEIENRAWRYAFGDPSSLQVPLRNVTIGDGITRLGTSAFYQNQLNEVVIGDSVEVIDSWAFYNSGVTKLTLGKSIETIANDAFRYNDIPELILPETLRTIGNNSFSANELTELVLPDSVDSIGDSAFSANNIAKLSIGELLSDENFGVDSFLGNSISDLTVGNVGFKHDSLGISTNVFNNSGFKLTFEDSAVGAIESRAWRYSYGDVTSLQVPIRNLTIGSGITSIGASSFYQNQLTEVIIGDGVETISGFAFYDSGLTKLTLGNSLRTISNDVFRHNDLTELVFPDSLESVGTNAFGSNDIRKVVTGANLLGEDISDTAFTGNSINDLSLGNVNVTNSDFGTSTSIFDPNGLELTYLDKAVGEIPNNAWRIGTGYSANTINKLTIGTGVTAIGDYSFRGNNVQALTIGESVTKIGSNAFNSAKVSELNLNSVLVEIGDSAFNNNTIPSVSVPDTVMKIGKYAFSSNNIATFNFVTNITHISEGMLNDNNLTSLVLPDHIEDIGAYAFRNNSISNLVLNDNITVFNTSVFENNEISQFTIEDYVTEIGVASFGGNNITSMVIPDTISLIADRAFENNDIASLVIGDTLTLSNFGTDTFKDNVIAELTVGKTDFKHNTFGASESVFASTGFKLIITNQATGKIVNNAWEYIANDSSTSNVQIIDVSIGDGITEIGDSAFLGNDLNTVVIGNGVHTLGSNVFDSTGVTNLTLGDSIVTVGAESFANNNLSVVIFPETLETIGDGVFTNNKFTELVLPNSVKYIGSNAFSNNQVQKLQIGELLSDENFGDNSFTGNAINHLTIGNIGFKHNSLGISTSVFASTGFKLIFEDTAIGKVEDRAWRYQSGDASSLQVPITDVTIGSGITSIGASSFYQNELNEVIIGDKVETISSFAFYNSGITKLTLGESLTTISSDVFRYNEITELNFPEKLKTIGNSAFSSNKISKLVIPDSVDSIGNGAFASNNMKELTIGKLLSDANFGDDSFIGNAITDLTIGNVGFKHSSLGKSTNVFASTGFSLTYADTAVGAIESRAWRFQADDDTSLQVPLKNVTIGAGITSIGSSAFYQNDLDTVVIGDAVESIAGYAFYNSGINSLTLGSSLISISNDVFRYNNISTLAFPENLETIGDRAFSSNKLTELVIPNTLDTIGIQAFSANSLTKLETEDLITANNFGSSPFSGNNISDLTLGNVNFTHATFGLSTSVFNNSGFKLTYAETAQGAIASRAWRYQSGDDESLEVKITGLTLGSGITSIGTSTFYQNNIGELVIGDSVTMISSYAFYKAGVTKVTLGSKVETISSYAFYDTNLTSLSLPSSVKVLGTNSFYSNNLTSVTLPNSLTSVGNSSFAYNSIVVLVVEKDVTASTLGTSTFAGNAIADLTLNNVSFKHDSFGDSATVFRASGFKLTYTDEAEGSIAGQAWRYAYGSSGNLQIRITGLSLGSGITTIGSSSFYQNGISNVVIGEGVKTIAGYAFYGVGATKVTIPASIETISNNAFTNNGSLSQVIFKGGTIVNKAAFSGNPTFYNGTGGVIS